MTNVLLAIDGPLYGKVISDFVINHHWAPSTQLKLLHVIEPLTDSVYPEAEWERKASNAAKGLLEEVALLIDLALPEINVSHLIRHGEPREEILKESVEWPANLLIVGSHGRRSTNQAFLGSVSLSILTQAHCTVIVVRVPQQKLDALAVESKKATLKTK